MTTDRASPPPSPTVTGRRGRPRLSEGARAERRLGWLLCAPAVIVMLAVTAYPIVYAIYLSLQRTTCASRSRPHFVGLSNYGTVLSSARSGGRRSWVTVFITVVSRRRRARPRHAARARHAPHDRRPRDWCAPRPDPLRHRHRGRRLLLAVRLDPGPRLPGRAASRAR